MIICKYTKTDNAVYVPHLDLLRCFTMAMRRRKIEVNFSEGYNPHAKIYFNQPLPIGASSLCEYFCADVNESADKFAEKLNASLPAGIVILKCAETDVNPNVANMMFSADYTAEFSSPVLKGKDFSSLSEQSELNITYVAKGKEITKNVSETVLSVKNDDRFANMRLRCGNVNLRADRLASHILKLCGAENMPFCVVKTAVYDCNNVNLDKIFFGE